MNGVSGFERAHEGVHAGEARPGPAPGEVPAGLPEVVPGALLTREWLVSLLRELAYGLLALVWPTECAGCGAADRDLCDACLAEVRSPPEVMVREIGLPCFAAGPYKGPVRAMLVGYKHAGRLRYVRELAPRLREPLAIALARCQGPRAPVLVAMPSRGSRVRERGYQHVELLVRRALRGSDAPVLRLPALRAGRGRSAQVGLDAAARERNARRLALKRAYRQFVRGREVILVDDIVTTGATLRAAAALLEAAGAQIIAAAVVCAVPRYDFLGSAGRVC